MIKPEKLKIGDTIGFIAPSYKPKRDPIERSAENLRKLGYKVKFSKNLFSTTNDYAGSIEERAEDLNAMIADPEVKMIYFGGGEVGNELLPFVDYENIKKNPKILLSYSDSTTLLNAINKQTGLVTFYGSSPRFFENEPTDYTLLNIEKRLCTNDLDYVKNSEWRVITPGKAEGILIGGYLINFATLIGLEWYEELPDEDIILFIEDHEKFSSPAMISKWFTMLEHKGVFKRTQALIFGHYSLEERPVIDDILSRIGNRYNIPVIRNDDFGHGVNGAILPISVRAKLDTEDMSFELFESGVE
ncbi:MAG: LD-carboxypeptidase [Clostridia bacterium]|nr:LD-carboxypeptidase [Clostridia bacterium]